MVAGRLFGAGLALVCLIVPGCILFEPITARVVRDGNDGPTGDTGPTGSSGASGPTGCDAPADCATASCIAGRCTEQVPRTCANGVPSVATPVTFFTDITSGPVTGGEGGLGSFITVYGLRFGAERGSSFVSINGVEVARYVSWNEKDPIATTDAARFSGRGLERIVVQPGPAVTSGELLVVVEGRASNPQSFTVRAGDLFFVDPLVATSGSGAVDAPFKHIWEAKGPAVGPGDIVYVKSGGALQAPDPIDLARNISLILNASTIASGAPALPIAYIGYPSDPPLLGGATSATRATAAIAFDSDGLNDFVIANMYLAHAERAVALSAQAGLRLVGNKIEDTGTTFLGAINAQDHSRLSVLGNYFYANDNDYAVLSTQGNTAQIDIGWNEFFDSHVLSHSGAANTYRFHDNLSIRTSPRIDFGISGAMTGVTFFNNVFFGPPMYLSGVSGNLSFLHNTWVDLHSAYSLYVRDPASATGSIALHNNILAGPEYVHTENDLAAFVAPSHNLYEGAGPSPFGSETEQVVALNPGYAAKGQRNVSLSESSPALNEGKSTDMCADFAGVTRPQAAAPDIGAYERP
jgi:hypothetical protein